MTLRQKALRGLSWSALQNWGTQAISFLVFLVLARLLTPEAFGLVALAGGVLQFLALFGEVFVDALVQRRDLDAEHLDTAFWADLVIGVGLTALSCAAAGPLSVLYKEPQLAPLIYWLSVGFLCEALSRVQGAILTRQFAFRGLAARNIVARIAGGTVGVTMACTGFGVWSLVGQQLVNSVVGVVVLWRVTDWRPRCRFSLRCLRELLAFGRNVLGLCLIGFFTNRSDTFLIAYFLGPAALGYYAVASRVLQILMELLTRTTTSVALPTFSQLQADPERLRSVFYWATRCAALVALPTYLAVGTLAPELVVLIFGREWLASIPVLQVLTVMGAMKSLLWLNGTVLVAMGKPAWMFKLAVIEMVINVLAILIVVQNGILAVATAMTVTTYLLAPLNLWVIRRWLQIDVAFYLKQFAVPLGASLAMFVAIQTARQVAGGLGAELFLVLGSALGALVYGACLWWWMPGLPNRVWELAHSVLPRTLRKKT